MAVTALTFGTQTAVVNTEHFLSNVNVAGVFLSVIDLNAMAAGDVVELRSYAMTLTSGSVREEYCGRFYGVQTSSPVKRSRPLSNELTDSQSLRFSLKQIAGTTGRAFPWKVLSHT